MNSVFPFDALTKAVGQLLECQMLACKQRIATFRRDCNAVKACACWRSFLKTPVCMPGLSEDGGRLVSGSLHSNDVLTPWDRSDEGIVTERTEHQGETLQIIIVHRLFRKREHMVLQPGRTYFVCDTVRNWLGQIHSCYGCAEWLPRRANL